MGRAQAMARMAALGEEWAEEEELPGKKMPLPSTTAASVNVKKETQKAMQRSKKIAKGLLDR